LYLQHITNSYKPSNLLFICKNCKRSYITNSQSHAFDQLEQEATKILNDEKKSFNIYSSRFAVIQPIFQDRKDKSLTTPNLKLEECVGLVNSVQNWKVCQKELVYVKNKKSLFISRSFTTVIKSLADAGINCVFVSLPRLTGAEVAFIHQTTNIEKIYDRYSLVLHIFNQRATSKHSKLQVLLAELPYKKLMAQYSLDQNYDTEVLSMRGESHFELMMRKFGQKEKQIKKLLKKMDRLKKLKQEQTRKSFIPTVAVVGYTNSGKTSLINRLTESEKFKPENKLFATLDASTQISTLPQGTRYMLIDTVGFLSNLPHSLIAAFHSTLQDMINADIIIHIRDISHPASKLQLKEVLKTLSSLQASRLHEIVECRNKSDIVQDHFGKSEVKPVRLTNKTKNKLLPSVVINISCKSGVGLSELEQIIEEELSRRCQLTRYVLKIPANGDHFDYLLRHNMANTDDVQGVDDFYLQVTTIPIFAEQFSKFIYKFSDVEVLEKIQKYCA